MSSTVPPTVSSAGEARSLVLDEGVVPDRLDRVLARAFGDLSRARLQTLVRDGLVRCDGTVVRDPARKVAAGGRIDLTVPAPLPAEPLGEALPLAVVHEDEDLIVIDKPAGLVVHPAAGHEDGTLVNRLIAHCGGSLSGIGGVRRPGIVHRLDKGTSGLLVVARDATTREGLKRLFAAHDITREYVAIAVGDTPAATFDTPHGRHPRDRTRFTSFAAGALRRAITHVEVIERLAGATLVRCRLETGRTHQIRIHLAERAKTPILGDPLYGVPPKGHLAAVARALGHQALHARVLGFVHPRTGRTLRFESEPPEDFQAARTALGGG